MPREEDKSLLEELMDFYEEKSSLRLSFEDLSGITQNIESLKLKRRYQLHTSEFCQVAKSCHKGGIACEQNKHAVNRLVRLRKQGLCGFCHLGLFDIAEPLIYKEHLFGIFYFGSVVIEGRQSLVHNRIQKHCARKGSSSERLNDALLKVPVEPLEKVEACRNDLKLLCRVIQQIMEGLAIQVNAYRFGKSAHEARERYRITWIVSRAMQYLQKNFTEPLKLNDIAKAIGCHPVNLSRDFKAQVGIGIIEYLHHIRIEHAVNLLTRNEMTATQVGYEVGYLDKSHFSRIFRKHKNMSPGQFKKQNSRVDG